MSLTKDAVQYIEKEKLAENLNAQLGRIDLASKVIALPDGVKISDLEGYMDCRSSYRFKFLTESIKDFGEYCREFSEKGAKCFLNPGNMCAEAIFDLGTRQRPLHQKHKATLKLKKTAAFCALLSVAGGRLSQGEVASFVEDWADNITAYSECGEGIKTNQAVRSLRAITVERVRSLGVKVGDLGGSMSAFEKIEAKSQSLIPVVIHFSCRPYHGLGDRAFKIRLSISADGEKPEFSLRIIGLQAQEESVAEEFKEILGAEFEGCDLSVLMGEPQKLGM